MIDIFLIVTGIAFAVAVLLTIVFFINRRKEMIATTKRTWEFLTKKKKYTDEELSEKIEATKHSFLSISVLAVLAVAFTTAYIWAIDGMPPLTSFMGGIAATLMSMCVFVIFDFVAVPSKYTLKRIMGTKYGAHLFFTVVFCGSIYSFGTFAAPASTADLSSRAGEDIPKIIQALDVFGNADSNDTTKVEAESER